MKNRPVILRIIAILMILVFSQKSGTGLFLHNLLHKQNLITEHPEKEEQKTRNLGYACSCIDDFFMPFDEVIVAVSAQPVLHIDTPRVFINERVSLYSSYFVSLRGPPAI